MSALATLLGTYAPGHVLTHAGKEFTFARIDKAKRVALEVAYYRRAREIVYDLKEDLTEAQYDRHLTRVTDAYRRGEYGFPHGESYGYYMGRGMPELIATLTGCAAEEAESLHEDRQVEVLHVVLCVVTESFKDLKKKILQMADDPQMLAMAALLTSNGSPSPKPTTPPASPTAASASSSTPV